MSCLERVQAQECETRHTLSLTGSAPGPEVTLGALFQGLSCAIILVSGPVAFFQWLQGLWL